MAVLYSYKLKRPCGYMRPFCRTCVNTFSIDSCGGGICGAKPPSTVCLYRDVPGCEHPEIIIPKGFVVMVYLNGGAATNVGDGTHPGDYGYGRDIGPLYTEPTATAFGDHAAFSQACPGVTWRDLPGEPGYMGSVGCGWRIDTTAGTRNAWPQVDPDNPWLPDGEMTGPSFTIGFTPKAVLFTFPDGLDIHFTDAYDAYGSPNDYSTLNYMQKIRFDHFCGHTGMAPGHETYIEAFPYR